MRRAVLVPTIVAVALRARHALLTVSLTAMLALTLTAPVAAQEETTSGAQTTTRGNDTTGKQEQVVQGSDLQDEGETRAEDERVAGRATESLQRAEALIIEDSSDRDETVDRIEIDAVGCEIDESAVVTVDDENGDAETFTNSPADSTRDADKVEATVEPAGGQVIIEVIDDASLAARFGSPNADEDGTVTSATGFTCGRDGDTEGGDSNEEAGEAAEQSAPEDGNCENAEEVERLSGNGDQQSPRFNTTGDSFRVTSEVDATDERLLVYSITINDENGDFVTSIDQEEEGTNVSFVNTEPGTYFLDVISANANYTITVEDCAGVDSSGNGDDIVNDPGGNLPDTGGPSLLALAVLGVVSAAAGLSMIRGGRR